MAVVPMVTRNPGEIDAHRARLALTQEFVGAEPCPVCRFMPFPGAIEVREIGWAG